MESEREREIMSREIMWRERQMLVEGGNRRREIRAQQRLMGRGRGRDVRDKGLLREGVQMNGQR